MQNNFKEKMLFQICSLMSLTFTTIYAITSMIMVGTKSYSNRGYLFGIVIWCFIVGIIQAGYLLYNVIYHLKKRQPFYYLLTINTATSTLLSITLLFIEYFIFNSWYKSSSMNTVWNGSITYSLYGIVIALFIFNCVLIGYVLGRTRVLYEPDEDIDMLDEEKMNS